MLALLFGSTWTANAVVFAAVLLTIFLANLAVLKGCAPRLRLAWCGALAFVLANFLLPTHWLAGLAGGPRVLACGLLVGLPVFCAAVCFSRLFQRQAATGYALGVNLIGAMAGGTLEYASMALGLRAVWLVALAIYGLAWLASEMTARTAKCGGAATTS